MNETVVLTVADRLVQCPECHQWAFTSDGHVCPPLWICKRDNQWEPDEHKIHGMDAEEAAVAYCEARFSEWEYPRTLDDVIVTDPRTGEEFTYFMEVEAVPSFLPALKAAKTPEKAPLEAAA